MVDVAAITPAIEVRHVTKEFSGVKALRDANLCVRRGETHALLGQNGAGKSTLVKILNGVHAANSYSGAILLDGRPVQFTSPSDARRQGVAYVPQEIEVLAQLSVAENIFAGQTGLGEGRLVRSRRMETKAAQILGEIGLGIDAAAKVAHLNAAQRHLVMIARALSTRPRVLMLDEPTASLSSAEVDRLLELLGRLQQGGATILYISHRLAEVLAVCDRATILKDGVTACVLDRGEITQDVLIQRMSGRKAVALFPEREVAAPAAPVLEVTGLSMSRRFGVNRALHEVGFSLRPGEVLGLAGLLGSGRTEILGALYGLLPHTGAVRVAGRPVAIDTPAQARAVGIAMLSEDRKHNGLLFNLPAGQNITIGNLAAVARRGVVDRNLENRTALEQMHSLNIKARSPAASVAHLSGGNQQKLLFARVLLSKPRILLLDEPTKGVDAATRHEIYRLIADLARAGVALIVVCSDLEEVLGLADRCLVISHGRVVDQFARGEGSDERVLRASEQAQRAQLLEVS